MIKRLKNKDKIFLAIFITILFSFILSTSVVSNPNLQLINKDQNINNSASRGTEYWALLVAVGVYADNPQQDRPLMLEEVDDLYETLIQTETWDEDHIKVIRGKDATVSNIVSGLRWLDRMEDKDDFSLVFITTHGDNLKDEEGNFVDIPPKDEADGSDEMLVSYWGFTYRKLFIYDDELNFLLNRLESKGVCLIIDSCHAGGFNDPPNWLNPRANTNQVSAEKWIEGFGEELSGQNRVVLMASEEDQVAYSGGFAPYLIDGIRGFANTNEDNIVSAEELYYYSEPRAHRQHPTMFDGYPGEFPLVYLDEIKDNPEIEKLETTELEVGLSPENSKIKGYIKDEDADDPIQDAYISIRGRDDNGDFYENETTSDLDGYYSVNIPPGRCFVTVYTEGYLSDTTDFDDIGENEIIWANFSLEPHPPENSIICGYIKDDETGDPIIGANISMEWRLGHNQFYFNETNSDINGFYHLNVAAGQIELDVRAKGYFREDLEDIYISENETRWINFSLSHLPLENSVICGFIKDKETGQPINHAEVTFEWNNIDTGSSYQNETFTDSDGFYKINIAFGEIYHNIREQGYDYYNPYRVDVLEDDTFWFNVSLEEETIDVEIAKPLKAFYINNNRIFPYFKTRIIGKIDIEATVDDDWWGPSSVEKIEFYIDDELKDTVDTGPYIYTWSEKKIGKHTIKVIAYDFDGSSDTKEIEVYKLF